MARAKTTSLAGIFDEPDADAIPERSARPALRVAAAPKAEAKNSHPGKKPVLIHIPEDMHRVLRQLSVEEGGEPLTKIVERSLRDYLIKKGHTRFVK